MPMIKRMSHLPIIVDPSWNGEILDVEPLKAMAGIGAGADGLMVEVHIQAQEVALSDGPQSLTEENFF